MRVKAGMVSKGEHRAYGAAGQMMSTDLASRELVILSLTKLKHHHRRLPNTAPNATISEKTPGRDPSAPWEVLPTALGEGGTPKPLA